MSAVFSYTVSAADTDAGGIVYYVNYLKIAERAREALLAPFAADAKALAPLWLVVDGCEVKYQASAQLGDALSVHTRCLACSEQTAQLEQRVMLGERLLVQLAVSLGCRDAADQPVALPAAVRAAFNASSAAGCV